MCLSRSRMGAAGFPRGSREVTMTDDAVAGL